MRYYATDAGARAASAQGRGGGRLRRQGAEAGEGRA
jgi:hypothetical protein